MKEFHYVDVQFVDPDGRHLHSKRILAQKGWSPEQCVSVARMQSRDYAAKVFIKTPGYTYFEIPEETRPMYNAQHDGKALWCNVGEHAFDPADSGRKRLEITEFDDDGNAFDRAVYTCGTHAKQNGLFSRRDKKAVAAITPPEMSSADADLYREFLEWKNGMRDEPA